MVCLTRCLVRGAGRRRRVTSPVVTLVCDPCGLTGSFLLPAQLTHLKRYGMWLLLVTTPLSIAARSAYILRDNSTGPITKAAPSLYPHQWSWDAAFNAIGLATIDLPRARLELDSLFAGQWRNGLLPHIVFDPNADGYWTGPAQWEGSAHSEEPPFAPGPGGIIAPPVHAIAVDRILAIASSVGGPELARTEAWARGIYPRLLAWHRFLAHDRADKETGLMTLFHGWESGTDNSPRWDAPYAGVKVGPGL